MSTVLVIPKHISADGLVPFLAQLADNAESPSLEVDFANLGKVSPAGLVALTSIVAYRNRKKLATQFTGFEKCGIASYLRRMDLPIQCGIPSEGAEAVGIARDPKGRFIPLEEIDDPVRIGSAFAEIFAPGGDDYDHPNAGLYDAAYYLITEIANNVRQHSQGRGFIAAQTTQMDGFIRIAIGDCGCGIPGSLKNAGHLWADELSDEEIIARALDARISCKGPPTNEGVGLTFSSRLTDAMGGHLLIASGSGMHIRLKGQEPKRVSLAGDSRFPGTLITMTFRRSAAADFQQIFDNLKNIEFPLRPSTSQVSFES